MHVRLGEETYSHRDPDESDFPTISQNQTLLKAELTPALTCQCLLENSEGSGDVVSVLTLLVGGVAQAFHDDRVVELRVQLGVQEVEGKRQGGTDRSRKGEASQRGCAMMMTMDECEKTQDLSQ